ncbi:RNA-binding protein [Sulfurifustis variabilis]|uniref:RNA-binding protein n=1 Tax=Sulfurifustis variabilis TaxID=1675686 RepID=A0A1C7AFU0_9GAMM|nr:RNA-binding protein [Sulfurifustis variabilis]BAU50268.1 RNA-binding protein [Sulfurifustis variabilis]
MNIFVSNLDRTITSGDLRRTFSGYGTVINAIVMHDTATGKPLGHAHVYLVPENAAREAIAELQFAPLRGRPIKVRECVYRARSDRRMRQSEGIKVERRRASDRRRQGLSDLPGAAL